MSLPIDSRPNTIASTVALRRAQQVDAEDTTRPAVEMRGEGGAGRDTIVVHALVIAAVFRIALGSFAPAHSCMKLTSFGPASQSAGPQGPSLTC